MRSAAAAIGPASASMACSLRCALSEKFSLMRVMRSIVCRPSIAANYRRHVIRQTHR